MKCLLRYWVTLAVLSYVVGDSDKRSYPKRIVQGIYASKVEGSMVYDTVAPITYEIDVPEWSRAEFQIPRSQNCTNSSFTKSSTCPVLHYLPNAQDRFDSYLENQKPLGSTFDANENGVDTTIEFDCDKVAPHFSGKLFYSKDKIEEYMRNIVSCPVKASVTMPIQTYNYNISGVYREMRQGFYREFWVQINDNEGRIDSALWSNSILALNSMTYLNYYLESNRWKMAVIDCKAGRFPSTLIEKKPFIDSLTEIFDKVSKKYVPVLHHRDLPLYYSMPLTDCTFTDKNTFLVRTLVPLQSLSSSSSGYSLYKLTTTPFSHHDEADNTSFVCEIRKSNNYVLYDEAQSIAYETDCDGKGLCQSPGWLNSPKVDSCATSVITKYFTGIVRFCEMHCEEISPWQYNPIARNIDSNSFSLTMHPRSPSSTTSTAVKCPGRPDMNINSVPVGAVQIELPCDCVIHSPSALIKVTTCVTAIQTGDVSIQHTVPLHWINEKRLSHIDTHQNSDMTFRPTGVVIQSASKKYLTPTTTSSKLISNSANNGSGDNNGVKFFFCYTLIFIMMGLSLFAIYSIHKLKQTTSEAYSCAQVSYTNANNAPLLANDGMDYPAGNY